MVSPDTIKKILLGYDIADPRIIIKPYGNGLINNTWKVSDGDTHYILQKINDNVFKRPLGIEHNIHLIAEYLKKNQPGYLFTAPVKTKTGEEMIHHPEGYFRLFSFIKNSHTVDVVDTPQQAFEAARQFGLFTKMLTGFPADSLKATIPDFHNLMLRARQFKDACKQGNPNRIKESVNAIQFIRDHTDIIRKFQNIQMDENFKLRVTHHDTKISNVLFDEERNGLCVIDLDTVMPGYFISDVGDMMRTYLSPVNEEEKELDKIEIREDFFQAIIEGYMQQMSVELSEAELKHFVYAGKFMIYMQAIRFLTDYLNNDKYYGAVYEKQNYVRANNQVTLLQRLLEKENLLNKMVAKN
ncbi:MAG: aminoglycoside phosphotransferase [Chitinophagaceae bacterium]|nr:aminoglycoside phosphotransferase [Chitinophagaceae bacterium]